MFSLGWVVKFIFHSSLYIVSLILFESQLNTVVFQYLWTFSFVNSVNLSHQPSETKDDIEMKAKKPLSKKNSGSWLKYPESPPGETEFIRGMSAQNGCIHKQQSIPTLHLTLIPNTF